MKHISRIAIIIVLEIFFYRFYRVLRGGSWGGTPTIPVNGYKLPDNYKIEDLRFMSNIEI